MGGSLLQLVRGICDPYLSEGLRSPHHNWFGEVMLYLRGGPYSFLEVNRWIISTNSPMSLIPECGKLKDQDTINTEDISESTSCHYLQ